MPWKKELKLKNQNQQNDDSEPEEEIKAEEEKLNLDNPDFSFKPKGIHAYVQNGYFLVCNTCDLQHAIYIGPDHLLTGFSPNGEPILKTRKELGMA